MAEAAGGVLDFEGFVRDRSDRLLRLAWLVTGNWDDARDAVQDALEGVLSRWPGLAASDRRDAYVHRCVVNACLSTQIGAALGCPEATARSHVHRALAALRARLEEGQNDG